MNKNGKMEYLLSKILFFFIFYSLLSLENGETKECDLSGLFCFVLRTTSVSPLDRDKGGGP